MGHLSETKKGGFAAALSVSCPCWGDERAEETNKSSSSSSFYPPQLHPVVLPQVSHFMHVPLRTSVKLPHSEHISPS